MPARILQSRQHRLLRERSRAAGVSDLLQFLVTIRTSPNCFSDSKRIFRICERSRGTSRWINLLPLPPTSKSFDAICSRRPSRFQAEQNHESISRGPASGVTAIYDRPLIRRCLIEIARQNAIRECFFHAYGVRLLVVDFGRLWRIRAVRSQVASFVESFCRPTNPSPGPGPPVSATRRAMRGASASSMIFAATGRTASTCCGRISVATERGRKRRWKRRIRTALRMP